MNKKKLIKMIFAMVIAICCLIWSVILRYKNLDMTTTRLLVTYWKEYLIIVLSMFGASLMIN